MLGKLNHYVARVSVISIMAALVAGMGGCGPGDGNLPPSQNLEIRDWYDLDAVRGNLAGNHTLMNDLDSTTAGYTELASPTANEGKGWEPIAALHPRYGLMGFEGAFDGQGYEIRDLFINRPNENGVGLFGDIWQDGVIKDIGVMNVTVIGGESVGGLAGSIGGNVYNSYSSGNVTGDGAVGGLAGINDGTVSESYSTGSVTGHGAVGGLVGVNFGTVSNSYSSGNVTGGDVVGGLAGYNKGGSVISSYSTGKVIGNEDAGGLVGLNEDVVSNSFWDIETSGQATSAGGTGRTAAQMRDIATFSGAGWNIVTVADGETNSGYIWNTINGVTYPFLSWEVQTKT